ncbi:MAG: hypothetical protein ABSE73_24970 [Planctomycetota bacterium]
MTTVEIKGWALVIAMLTGSAYGQSSDGNTPRPQPDEFAELERQVQAGTTWNLKKLQAETFRQEALVFPADKTPVDIVWRRTRALAEHLRGMVNAPGLSEETRALEALGIAVEGQRNGKPTTQEQRRLFDEIAALRRKIAFKNPLLDFDAIVFLKHNMQARGEAHMVDQFLGFNGEKAGGVYVLHDTFGLKPSVESLLAVSRVSNGRLAGRLLENAGSFISLALDYDAKTILFAFTETGMEGGPQTRNPAVRNSRQIKPFDFKGYKSWDPKENCWTPETTYHVFRANVDGSGLTQLTDGPWNDYDPCFLPNGRIVFVSERNGGHTRCSARPLLCARLHSMAADGSDLVQLSWHDTSEWQPSVDHFGMIAYTRWDYVDRDPDCTQQMWTCYPDGRNPRSYHGNYPAARGAGPYMELCIRAIPGSTRYLAVAPPHHGQQYGTLILIDPEQPDDRRMSQVKRVTPEVAFPESETPWYSNEVFGTPWPLSEDFYLCVYSMADCRHGIYLADSFGNKELLYHDPEIGCLAPIPLKARPCPPVLPSGTAQARTDSQPGTDLALGTVLIADIYASEQPWPKGVKIKELRVVNVFPKDNPYLDKPNIGIGTESLARGVLGTAPVEEDGSAYFRMPTGASVYFQALDANGLAVQSMRSATYLHPGETLSCVGCHESKNSALRTGAGVPLALRRPPSTLRPEPAGSYPLTFPRLVQPVLDAKCVKCHEVSPKAPGLHGNRFVANGWSEAFKNLQPLAWATLDSQRNARGWLISIPGQEGARASKLYKHLSQPHHELVLTKEELRRITLWLDCGSNFYGAYHEEGAQARGEIVKPKLGTPAWVNFESLVR